MDIGALALLSEQKYAVQNLPKPKNTIVTFEDYEKITRNVMSSTEIVIHNVSKYAQQIFLELQDLREEVKNCSVKIGEELKELMRNHFLKGELVTDHHVYDGIPVSRDDFDLRKMEQTKVLQRMAQQQQELMQFIAKTEELMLKIEDESGLSLNDLTGAMHLLQQWSNTLETIEEKEKRLKREKEEQERAEREKEEEEMRRREQLERQRREKEEEEKQRKEQEEREKEEKERRQREEEEREKERERQKLEAEKKRRDWKNWPPFIFYNTRKNKFKQDLCCVLFTMPGEVTQEDFICHGSDADEDLDKCLESNDEQVLSSMITITPNKNRNIAFELPIRVYVPIVGHDSKLKPSLKFTVKGKKWRHGKTLPEIKLPPQFQNVAFVGVEIPIKELSSVQCVAIASYQKYTTDVNENGKSFELNIDKNIKVRIPANAFPGTTEVSTQSISSRQKDMLNAAKRHKELQSVKQAGNLVDISCENVTKEDSDLEMYDFGWVVDKNKQKHYNVHQETLARCSRWLVNNMNPDLNTLPLDEVFDSDFVEQLGTKETTGDKNRFILRGLHGLSKKNFNTFVEKLKASQKHVASRIKAVYSSVVSSRKLQDGHSEDDFGNDFDPDFERKDGSLQIVSKLSGESWEVVTLKDYDTDQNARVVKLPAGHDKYRVLALVVPENMPEDEICKAAEVLESIHCVTNVSIICRQKLSNPHDVIIDCVPSENVVDTLQQLDGLGYSIGPSESMAFGVVDGEEIVIKFEGNLYLERYKNIALKIKFYKNVPLNRFSGHLAVVSKVEQVASDQYHGFLTFDINPNRISVPRNGSMAVYIPKPMEELIGNFAYTLDVPVKALAKFVAWQLTRENFNSTRWVRLGGYLTEGDSTLYHQIIKRVDSERPKAPQRERCEQFILYWSMHHANEISDKVEKVIAAHHDPKLETEAQQFIRAYTSGKGLFSNDSLEKIAYAISEDWEVFAGKLGLTSDDINKIKSMHGFNVKQGLQMLDWWRLSDQAIQKGTDLVKSFHEMAKSAQLGAKLLSLVSAHL